MPLVVCSDSTKNYINGRKFLVSKPPTIELLKYEGKYDNVIAVGGGSVIDTAKILSSKPITCYPTTASGASATSHSVYWDGLDKKNSHRYKPKHVLFNDKFIETLPNSVLLNTRYDAISHCLDVLWSEDSNKVDIQEVEYTLDKLVNPNTSAIDIIKLGHAAGKFIEVVPTTILHALSYPITAKYGVPHGKALGFLIFPLCKMFNCTSKIKNLKKLDNFLDINVEFVILEACKYSKFFKTSKNIDLDKLKEILQYENTK